MIPRLFVLEDRQLVTGCRSMIALYHLLATVFSFLVVHFLQRFDGICVQVVINAHCGVPQP